MPKLLTNRESELFLVALHWYEEWNRSNPEVGMGPSRARLAATLAQSLSFDVDEDDIAEIAESVRGS